MGAISDLGMIVRCYFKSAGLGGQVESERFFSEAREEKQAGPMVQRMSKGSQETWQHSACLPVNLSIGGLSLPFQPPSVASTSDDNLEEEGCYFEVTRGILQGVDSLPETEAADCENPVDPMKRESDIERLPSKEREELKQAGPMVQRMSKGSQETWQHSACLPVNLSLEGLSLPLQPPSVASTSDSVSAKESSPLDRSMNVGWGFSLWSRLGTVLGRITDILKSVYKMILLFMEHNTEGVQETQRESVEHTRSRG